MAMVELVHMTVGSPNLFRRRHAEVPARVLRIARMVLEKGRGPIHGDPVVTADVVRQGDTLRFSLSDAAGAVLVRAMGSWERDEARNAGAWRELTDMTANVLGGIDPAAIGVARQPPGWPWLAALPTAAFAMAVMGGQVRLPQLVVECEVALFWAAFGPSGPSAH